MVNWPPPGGNWEGGMLVDGVPWEHVPHVGWQPVPPTALGAIYRDPRTLRRRSRLARWLDRHRYGILAATALLVVAGYVTTIALVFERTMPTWRGAAVLVSVGLVLVVVLLAVVIWSRRE